MALKSTLKEIQDIAEKKGGKCLSPEYFGNLTPLLWECKEGHRWEANPKGIKRGTWCPICAGILKLTIEDVKKTAIERGGKCLSEVYVNAQTKMLWECDKGHRWESNSNNIRQGKWCPICAGNTQLTIEDMKKIATERGGKCLSEKYINANTRMLWECEDGHRWEAVPSSIKNGSWCLVCFHKPKFTIEEMQELAKSKGGKCLSGKYVSTKTKLLWECKEGHRWETTPHIIKHGSWCPVCAKKAEYTLEDMLIYAKSKGGKCLSTKYLDGDTKLSWECKEGHKWQCTPKYIKHIWCPFCAGRVYITISDMQELAKSRGGKCLSPEYLGHLKKLLWECNKGHKWEAQPSYIKAGFWCKVCNYIPTVTLQDMQKIAESRKGKCLSTEYINDATKLFWECENEHRWEATPNHIKRGSWCPICHQITSRRNLSIYDMQDFAKSKKGKCISTEYKNNTFKLIWECEKGHQWEAKPNNVLTNGTWCPVCDRLKRIKRHY